MDHLKELEEIKHVGIIPHLTDELARGLLQGEPVPEI